MDKLNLYKLVLDSINDPAWLVGRDGNLLVVNKAWCVFFGFREDEVLGKKRSLFVSAHLNALFEEQDRLVFKSGESCRVDEELESVAGRKVWLEVIKTPIFDEKGEIWGLSGVSRDVTLRKQTEESLRQSEQQYRSLFESMISGFAVHEMIFDAQGKPTDYRFLDANPAFERITGLKAKDIIGHTVKEVFPNIENVWIENYAKVVTSGEPLHFEQYNQSLDRYFVVTAYRHSPGRFACNFVDITERKKAERRLSESEERFRIIASSTPDHIIEQDLNLRYVLVINPQLGLVAEQMIGKTDFDILSKADAETLSKIKRQVLETGVASHLTVPLISADGKENTFEGSYVPKFDANGSISGLIGYFKNITDRKEVELEHRRIDAKIQQANKLESIGVLAAGIAHDFNNILAGIFGYMELAEQYANKSLFDKVSATMAKALTSLRRAKDLTRQLLTFAKGGYPSIEAVDIAAALKDLTSFALSGSNVSAQISVDEGLWLCRADRNQFDQAMDNLLLNAKESMPDGGTIKVKAQNICIEKERKHDLPLGKYVRISISDSGIGISKENLKRIFDPFFTTKAKGQGLGLSIVYSIVKRHAGVVEVKSEPGMGTTFSVYLPAIDKMENEKEVGSIDVSQGDGRILVMDDDATVRELLAEMLSELGYGVKAVCNGEEAVSAYRKGLEQGLSYDAVILDLTVKGGMGGRLAAEALLRLDPQAKLIVSSGYAEDPLLVSPQKYGFKGVVAKPYRLNDITRVLLNVLNS